MADRGVGWARMFGRLSEYLSKEDLTDISSVRIYTKDKTLEYKIVSIYSANAGDDYRRNPSKKDKIKYLQKLVDRSARDFSFDRPVKENDKMITLSTCEDYNFDGRLVVHGILVNNSS